MTDNPGLCVGTRKARTLSLSCWMTSLTGRKKPGCVKLFQCFLFFNAGES